MIESDVATDRDERFEVYARAHLWIYDLRGRVVEVRPSKGDVPAGFFPFEVPAVHVITAYNPGLERLDAEENERRQRALVDELPATASRWLAEAGAEDGSHREASVLAVGLSDDDAIAIGARWGQDAIFRWTPDALSILPCDGGEPVDSAWSLVEHRMPLPDGVALVRRVRRPDGSSSTWLVSGGPEAWTVHDGGRGWQVSGFLSDVVVATPGLRDLELGTASDYELAEKTLTAPALASLLRVIGEGAEDPSMWPESEADRWWDEDIEDLEWRHRWVEINGDRASAVVVPGRNELQLVVFEDEDHLDVIDVLANFDWSSDGGGRPMSTDGGNSLGRLAPGLLYQRRWGDFGPEHRLVPTDDDVTSLAQALVSWVEWAEVEQSVALTQEPLDPERTLSDDVRETIQRQLDLCEIDLTFPDDEVGRRARDQLAHKSASYQRTREALAHPDREDGRALREMLAAVDDGEDVPDSVTWATWQGGSN